MSDTLIIGGVTMPTLAENGLTVTKEKIWSANTGRTVSGYMVGDMVAIKYKLQCTWPALSRDDVRLIDAAVTQPYFSVTFTDPATNSRVTKQFYAGTPTYPVFRYDCGVKTYDGVTVDLVER